MSNLLTRLEIFMKAKTLTVRAFEQSIGVGNGTIGKALKSSADANPKGIGSDVLSKIFDKYPELNITWLFNGKGQMLNGKMYVSDEVLDMAAEPPPIGKSRLDVVENDVKELKKVVKIILEHRKK